LAGKREICWCACITRTRDLRDIGPIPENTIFGDMFYWTKLAFKGRVGCVSSLLSHYIFMGDNLSSGVPVMTWTRAAKKLVDEMVTATIAHEMPDESTARHLRAAGARYLARSTSNQFVWCSIHGFKKATLLHELWKVMRYLSIDPKVWLRVIAAFVIPPGIQQTLILAAAKRQARACRNLKIAE
jgi:hypothetical protein